MSRSPIDITVGEALRRRREELKLSRAFVAFSIGLDAEQLGRYEHGEERAGAVLLVALARTLACPLESFFAEFNVARPPLRLVASDGERND